MTSALSSPGKTKIDLVFRTPEGDVREVTVIPKKDRYDQRPTIGIGQPVGRRLSRFGRKGKPLAEEWLPAGKAPFEPGDVVKALKPASLSSFLPVKDGFEIQLIESEYRDQPITYQVARGGDESPESTPKTVEITVQLGYFVTLGLRMKIGPIVSLSESRPECSKSLQIGDLITALNGDANFDPMRLPDQVHELVKEGKPATLQIQRGDKTFPLVVDPKALAGRGTWVEEVPVLKCPMAFPALGFSYRVEDQIAGIAPSSPAEKAGLHVGDTIKELQVENKDTDLKKKFTFDKGYAWPYFFSAMQDQSPDTLYSLTVVDAQGVERTSGAMNPVPDKTWYRYSRGLPLEVETRLRVAQNLWDAIEIGGRESYRFVGRIYLNLYSLIRGDISPELLAGPIKLAEMTYLIAHQGFIDLLHFLAIISINLAIVNFLPIPVLDGGHMVLLLAEKVRGRPLHETWVIVATYIGLAIVLLLMVSTIFIDITKFAWFQKLFNW
jgi:regulator of sigma E protease